MIILKKNNNKKQKNNNQDFNLSVFLENTFLEKLQEGQITPPPPSHFRVNATSFLVISQNYPSLDVSTKILHKENSIFCAVKVGLRECYTTRWNENHVRIYK